MTNLLDESLFRAHFEKVVQHHKDWMKQISAKGQSTIPAWLHLFDENFRAHVLPITDPEITDIPHFARSVIDKLRPEAYILITEAWNKRKVPEGLKIGPEIPYKDELILLPRDQWKEMVMFLAKIRDDRRIVIARGFAIKRKIHNDDTSFIESFEEMDFTNIRARELYFGNPEE